MNNIDLNIDNYNLNDLLSLFKLDNNYNYDYNDMKKAKKIVLMTHPDKSGLDKDIFLFFTKAYKILYSIFNIRHKNNKNRDIEINVKEQDIEIIKIIKNNKNFNKIFNELFEKYNIDEKHGYGEWLKSNDNMDFTNTTKNNMNNTFEEKKKHLSSIIVHKGIEDIYNNEIGTEIINNVPDYYTSSIFSNLKYEDLKKAHIENLIPVSNDDYNNIKKFKNVSELNIYRTKQNITPPSMYNSNLYLDNKKELQNIEDLNRTYKLVRQDEIITNLNNKILGNFKLLNN